MQQIQLSAPENIFYFKLQVTSKLKYNQKPNSIETRSGQLDHHIFVSVAKQVWSGLYNIQVRSRFCIWSYALIMESGADQSND